MTKNTLLGLVTFWLGFIKMLFFYPTRIPTACSGRKIVYIVLWLLITPLVSSNFPVHIRVHSPHPVFVLTHLPEAWDK